MRWTLFWGGPEHGTVKPVHQKHLSQSVPYICPVVRKPSLRISELEEEMVKPHLMVQKVTYNCWAFSYSTPDDDYIDVVMVYLDKEDRLFYNFNQHVSFILWMCKYPLIAYLEKENTDVPSGDNESVL